MNKHKVTEENKHRAKSLAAAGMPKEAIAKMPIAHKLSEFWLVIFSPQELFEF